MCCGTEGHHAGWHGGRHHGCSCGCGGPFRFGPRFWTEKEKIAWLEQYLEGLREEAKAVEERVAEMKEKK